MRPWIACFALAPLLIACQGETPEPAEQSVAASESVTPAPTAAPDTDTAHGDTPVLYDIDFTSIDGDPLPFRSFEGKAVLVVNTASRCGYTGQYAGLQSLWSDYKDKGLVVLGVPSNDFGGQEPGTEEEVKAFCEINYGVDFPLTAKTTVVGTGRHPFYAGLEDALGESARPKWNFHKVVIGPDGTAREAFPSSVAPDDPALIAAIDAALAS